MQPTMKPAHCHPLHYIDVNHQLHASSHFIRGKETPASYSQKVGWDSETVWTRCLQSTGRHVGTFIPRNYMYQGEKASLLVYLTSPFYLHCLYNVEWKHDREWWIRKDLEANGSGLVEGNIPVSFGWTAESHEKYQLRCAAKGSRIKAYTPKIWNKFANSYAATFWEGAWHGIHTYLLTYLLTYSLTPWCRILFEKL